MSSMINKIWGRGASVCVPMKSIFSFYRHYATMESWLLRELERERERDRETDRERKRDQPCILNVPTYNPVPRLVKVDKGER